MLVKLVALNGLLGYGYDEASLRHAFEQKPDYIGADGGSSDPGPSYLGSGISFTDRNAVKRDVALALPLALQAGAPFIVGTSGGSGSQVHLQWLREIFLEIAKEQNLSFKLATIETDVEKTVVLEKLEHGKIHALGKKELNREDVEQSVRIVSQIGADPIIQALKAGSDVVLAGRACDTAIYAAPCLLHGYDPGLAFHMAKIMECGAMCATPVAAADVMQAEITAGYFELTPANPARKCTLTGVAAHTMYEQADPCKLIEPDGIADLTHCQYEQITERTVRVSGGVFVPALKPTLKIEGVRLSGYRTISIAGIQDPETIRRIDDIFDGVCRFVRENAVLPENSYQILLRKYGAPECGMGIVLDTVGKTQQIADTVAALVRSRMLHYDYPNRKSTAGNLAFPYSPSDLHLGAVYTFSIYHIMEVDDLSETARIYYEKIGDSKTCD